MKRLRIINLFFQSVFLMRISSFGIGYMCQNALAILWAGSHVEQETEQKDSPLIERFMGPKAF